MTTPAAAFEPIGSRDAFVSLVQGRQLSGDGVRLTVTPDGGIGGRAFGFRVTGSWRWEGGYFCRTINTAVRKLPDNCQTVARDGNVLRFTADRGAGDSADLRIR
ncbi:MAG: dihydrodipicolinate reductase [Pseudomonadota bacterium]